MFLAFGTTAWRFIAAGLLTVLIAIGLEFGTNATPLHTPTDTSVALYSMNAEEEICLDDGTCGVLSVNLDSTRNGAGGVLCLTISKDDRQERGCTDVTRSVRVDAETGVGATLPATSLDLYTLTCDESGTCIPSGSRSVNIGAVWSSESPMSGSTDLEHTCAWPNEDNGAVRPASLQLTIDDYSMRAFGSIRIATAGPIENCFNRA